MSQQPHFVATATPQDISSGRENGCYLAQFSGSGNITTAGPVLYATAAVAPLDEKDYFEAEVGDTFQFWAGDDVDPTWVRRPSLAFDSPNLDIVISIARLT